MFVSLEISSKAGWRFASLVGCFVCLTLAADSAAGEHLHRAATIPLGDATGRIDHLAVDDSRKRLFVAELGSNRVAIVDIDAQKALSTIDGLAEPQGVAYEPSTDTLYIANGGDGTVRMYTGADYEPAGHIELHDDADNVRVDAARHRVLVGYGSGLAAIDIDTHAVRTFPLDGHPESIQVEAASPDVFINVPQIHALVSVDADGRAQRRSIPLPGANFPLALDDHGQLVLALRRPAALLVMPVHATNNEAKPISSELCDDADDASYDPGRQRLYVSCGDGHLDVFERTDSAYSRVDDIPTAHGARTSLFVAAWDRLFLAVPATAPRAPAAVWVMEPN